MIASTFPTAALPPHYFCITCAYLLISFLLSRLYALSAPLVPVSSSFSFRYSIPFAKSFASRSPHVQKSQSADTRERQWPWTLHPQFYMLSSRPVSLLLGHSDTRNRVFFVASTSRSLLYRFRGVVYLRVACGQAASICETFSRFAGSPLWLTRYRMNSKGKTAWRMEDSDEHRLNLPRLLALKVAAFNLAASRVEFPCHKDRRSNDVSSHPLYVGLPRTEAKIKRRVRCNVR